jgi:hypothetical protein
MVLKNFFLEHILNISFLKVQPCTAVVKILPKLVLLLINQFMITLSKSFICNDQVIRIPMSGLSLNKIDKNYK